MSNESSLSFNLSPVQLKSLDFIEYVIAILEKYEIKLSQIEFELTENQLTSQFILFEHHIEILKEKKIMFSIDDFCGGHSSIALLSRLPVKALKIAKKVIQQIGASRVDEAIVCSTITLADVLGFNVIAEGIETSEQLQFLIEHDCLYGQGYYYSKPMSEGKMSYFLERGEKYS